MAVQWLMQRRFEHPKGRTVFELAGELELLSVWGIPLVVVVPAEAVGVAGTDVGPAFGIRPSETLTQSRFEHPNGRVETEFPGLPIPLWLEETESVADGEIEGTDVMPGIREVAEARTGKRPSEALTHKKFEQPNGRESELVVKEAGLNGTPEGMADTLGIVVADIVPGLVGDSDAQLIPLQPNEAITELLLMEPGPLPVCEDGVDVTMPPMDRYSMNLLGAPQA
ncbi:MAG: hypothetical protein LQ346_007831 [Caloplaca aetnensis]|nr:MAG: hypothetical protein LQ346_007831 [Caloplaca aetnensis]